MRSLSMRGLFAIALAVLLPHFAAGSDDWKDDFKRSFEGVYPLAERKGVDNITDPTSVLVVRQPGIRAGLATDFRLLDVSVDVRNLDAGGKTPGGLFQDRKRNAQEFQVGELVHPVRYSVKDDEVHFQVMSSEMYQVQKDGNTQNTRYTVMFRFKFPKGESVQGNLDAVTAAVAHYFATEEEWAAANAAPQVRLAMGQTVEDVRKMLGEPATVIDLGAKLTYVYDGMKIVFMDGKVSDVQ